MDAEEVGAELEKTAELLKIAVAVDSEDANMRETAGTLADEEEAFEEGVEVAAEEDEAIEEMTEEVTATDDVDEISGDVLEIVDADDVEDG